MKQQTVVIGLADVDIYFTNQWKTPEIPGKIPLLWITTFRGLHFGRAVGCEESETSHIEQTIWS